jgi:taurine dioxygenase
MRYTITPLTPHTGAEVRGIDLNQGVDAETRAALNRAFAEHHVLVVQVSQGPPS